MNAAPSTTSPPHGGDPLVGKVLGGAYRITRLLAQGGMGAVYEAEHLRLHRPVAVKIVRSADASRADLLARFQHEVAVIAELGHPHVVQALDVGESATGDPFLVMELLQGETLGERLDRVKRLTVAETVRILSDVSAALAAAHSQGIVHRDLKPDNLFLVRVEGQPDFVKVLDFGVSKRLNETRRLTGVHSIVGTPGYMAPEQVVPTASIDTRVDQFALGAIAYRMLTGEEAFPEAELETVADSVLHSTPPPITELAPWVPAEVEAAVERAMAKDRTQRFRSISQFAWALSNAAEAAKARTTQTPTPTNVAAVGRKTDPARPNPPASSPVSARAPGSGPRSSRPERAAGESASSHARRVIEATRESFRAHRLDDAVDGAEQLLELLVFGNDPAVVEEVGPALSLVDNVFATRVGPLEATLQAGPRATDIRRLSLSPRAASLAARFESPTTVSTALQQASMPRRDAIRLLAGLLRRGVLETA
ncbi:MAG: serine/threonine protein kinase [Polyangiaceae bacterium]|nr:serine/threonine protein kinase [Polyangiaceae bacterium]